MKLDVILEKRTDTIGDTRKSIIQDRKYEVAAFFDLDGTLHFNDAQWKILPNKVEQLDGFLPLTPKERSTLRVTQERGAKFAEALRTKAGITDITQFFDMSEFGAREEYIKQVKGGQPIPAIIELLKKHITHNHRIYILTARSGKRQDLAKTFGAELDQFIGTDVFRMRGSVYTVNDPQFKKFWSTLGIHSSAGKKAAIIQSFMKYKDNEEPFSDNPNKDLFLNWRTEHSDKLVDKAYFYDDEMPNITAVENMLNKEQDKFLHGNDSVVVHFVREKKPTAMKESLKAKEVEMKLAGIPKHEVIKRLNEQDEVLSSIIENQEYDAGEVLIKRKAIVDLYKDLSKDNFERKFSNKFKFEIVEMANVFGIPQTNNKEGLTEMIYDKIKELNEMARVGELVKADGKLLKITKGNRGRGLEVEAGGKKFKLKSNNPTSDGGKSFYEVEKEVTAADVAAKAQGKEVAEKAKAEKKAKVGGKASVAIPAKFRPTAFVNAFVSALRSNKTEGVSEKGKPDSFEVENASDFVKRFKSGLAKQENLKFKDALIKLADVASVIVKIHSGSATPEECQKLDAVVAGVTTKSGKEMSFSSYLSALKKAGKDDVFHSKVKEKLQKVIDKKTAQVEKSLGDARGEKAVEEELVYLNPDASRLLDKIEEASMYESGIKMFLEGVIANTPEEGKDALHENLKTAFKALALNKPAYAEILD
jgi:hypothetical protein